jgi:hypothetical protein
MKLRLPFSSKALVALVIFLIGVSLAAEGGAGRTNATVAMGSAAPTNAEPVEVIIPQSAFLMPLTKEQGKDPFFPRSLRPYATAPVTVVSNVPALPPPVELKINGTSGSEERPLVIINNVTFGVGDSGEVTSGGRRVRIQCLEISLSEGKATIEVQGGRRVLFFQKPSK